MNSKKNSKRRRFLRRWGYTGKLFLVVVERPTPARKNDWRKDSW